VFLRLAALLQGTGELFLNKQRRRQVQFTVPDPGLNLSANHFKVLGPCWRAAVKHNHRWAQERPAVASPRLSLALSHVGCNVGSCHAGSLHTQVNKQVLGMVLQGRITDTFAEPKFIAGLREQLDSFPRPNNC
jgi:hypothetical protein